MRFTVEQTKRGFAVFSQGYDAPIRQSKVYRTMDEALAARLRLISDLYAAEAAFERSRLSRIVRGA